MADYKAIHGKNILHVASDLDSAEGEGQIWFNTTSSDYKTIVKATAAWASGGAMNTARRNVGSAGATQSSAMVAAGTPPQTGITETYDGTSWTEVGDLNQVRVSPEGDGPITAALMIGGYTDPPTVFRDETELYNGTSWTELNDLNTGRDSGSAMGTSTAMEFVGGAAGGNQDISETFDGTSWTEGSDLNTGRHSAGPAGTATAGAIFGGLPASNPPISLHEQHDGSSWTEVADLNTGRYTGAGCGTQTAALYACGNTGSITGVSEIWDGTAWAATATASEARQGLGGAGTTSAAAIYGGINPPLSPAFRATTEEYTGPSVVAASVTST